jgi:hypothetical protein
MEVEDDDAGWDGPNIRPPQLKRDKSGDERRSHGHQRSSSGRSTTQHFLQQFQQIN